MKRNKPKFITKEDSLRILETYPRTKLVYDFIKEHPNTDAREIAAGLGEKQVYVHVNRLEDYGLVSVQKQKERHYTVRHYTAIERRASHISNVSQEREPMQESRRTVRTSTPGFSFDEIFNECLFDDLDEDITNPNFLLSIGGVDCVQSGSIVAVSGKPGVGKSTFLSIIAGVLISGREFGTIQCKRKSPHILWIDTEKDPFTCKQRTMTLRHVAGLSPNSTLSEQGVSFLRMSTKSIEDRMLILEAIANDYVTNHYDVVIIDGIFDLTDAPDKLDKVRRVIDMLKCLSGRGITVFGMLHTNKSKEDDNMREKIGTDFLRICTNCFLIEIDKNDSHKIIHKKTNNTQYAPTATFKYDENGIAIPFSKKSEKEESPFQGKDKRTLVNETRFKTILSGDILLSRVELIQKLGEGEDGLKSDAAKKAIQKAYHEGLIGKESGKYGKYYLL